MADLYFEVDANFQKLVELRKEIQATENTLMNMDTNAPAEEVRKLEDKLATLKGEFNESASAAAEAGRVYKDQLKVDLAEAARSMAESAEKAMELSQSITIQKGVVAEARQEVEKMKDAHRELNQAQNVSKETLEASRQDILEAIKSLNEEEDALDGLVKQHEEATRAAGAFGKEYQKLTKTIENGGEEVNEMEELMNEATDKIKGAAITIFGITGIKDFIGQMIEVRSQFQAADTAIQTMLGNKEKADALMAQVREYATISPLDFSSITSATQMMLGFNIEAEKVPKFISAIGDVSMGNSQKFNSLTLAFSQMSAAGKLMGQDLLQMINAGFNPLQTMADKTGKSISDLKKEMSEGKISAEMVQQAFIDATSEGGKFYKMSEKGSQTIQGQMSMLRDSMDAMFNDLGTKSEGVIQQGLVLARKLVESYQTIGKIIGGLVVTYGAYRAAVAVAMVAMGAEKAAIEADTIAKQLNATWTTILEAKTKLLNAQLMLNPYVAVGVAVAALVAGIYALATADDAATSAKKKYNEELQKNRELIEQEKQEISNLVGIIRNTNSTNFDKAIAYDKLKKIAPSLTEIYTSFEQIANLEDGLIEKKIGDIANDKQQQQLEDAVEKYRKTVKKIQYDIAHAYDGSDGQTKGLADNYVRGKNQALEIQKQYLDMAIADLVEFNRIKAEANTPVETKIEIAESELEQAENSLQTLKDFGMALKTDMEKPIEFNATGEPAEMESDKMLKDIRAKIEEFESKPTMELTAEDQKALTTLRDLEAKMLNWKSQCEADGVFSIVFGINADMSNFESAINRLKALVSGLKSTVADAGEEVQNYAYWQKKLQEAQGKKKSLSSDKIGSAEWKQAEKDELEAQKQLDKYNKSKQSTSQRSSETAQRKREAQAAQAARKAEAEKARRQREAERNAAKRQQHADKAAQLEYANMIEQQKIDKADRDWKLQNQRANLELEKDGYNKQIKLLENEYEERKNKVKDWEEDYLQQIRDAKVKEWKAKHPDATGEDEVNYAKSLMVGGTNEISRTKGLTYDQDLALSEHVTKETQTNDDWYNKQQKQIQQTAIGDLLNFNQQRLKIEEDYQNRLAEIQSMGLDPTEETSALNQLTQAYEGQVKSLMQSMYSKLTDDNELKESISSIGEEGEKSFAKLMDIILQIEGGLDDTLNAENLQTINDLLDKLQQSASTATSEDGTIGGLRKQYEALRKAQNDTIAAKARLDKAMKAANSTKATSRDIKELKDATVAYTKALGKETKAQNKFKKSQKDTLGAVDDLLNSIKGVGDAVGGMTSDITGMIVQLGLMVTSSIRGFQTAAEAGSQAIKTVERASVIIAIIGTVLEVAMKVAALFSGGNEEAMAKQVDKLTNQSNALKKSIDALTGKLSEANSTQEALMLEEMARTNQEKLNATRMETLKAQMRSWKKDHSNQYYWSVQWNRRDYDSLNKGLEQYYKMMGQNKTYNVRSLEDVYKLSPEEIAAIRDYNAKIWAKITSTGNKDAKEYWEAVADGFEESKELADTISEAFLGNTFDDMYDEFVEMLSDMENLTEDFGKDFSETLYNAMLNSMVADGFKDRLKLWYTKVEEFAKNREKMTVQEQKEAMETLRNEYVDMAKDGQKTRDLAAEISGYKADLESSSQEASVASVTNVSEDTAQALLGRMTAINESQLRTEISNETMRALTFDLNTKLGRIDMSVYGIKDIASETRDAIERSFLELTAIRENTGAIVVPIKAMQADIATMKNKISNL